MFWIFLWKQSFFSFGTEWKRWSCSVKKDIFHPACPITVRLMKCQAALKAFQKPGRDAALHQAVTPQWNLSELTATLRTKDLTDLQKSDYSCFSLIVFFLLFPPSSKEQVCLLILFYLDLHELMKIKEEENIHTHACTHMHAQTHTHVHAHTRACTADHGRQNGVFFISGFYVQSILWSNPQFTKIKNFILQGDLRPCTGCIPGQSRSGTAGPWSTGSPAVEAELASHG